jgi:hypothetical protein
MLTRLSFTAHRALQATPRRLKDLHRQFLGSTWMRTLENLSDLLIEFVDGIHCERLRRCSNPKAKPAKMQKSVARILGNQPIGGAAPR